MKRKVPVKVQVWIAPGANATTAEKSSQLPVRPVWKTSWKTKLLTTALLASAAGLIAAGSWLAVGLIVNPASLSWLQIPSWSDLAATKPQTLAEIKSEVQKAGHSLAAPIYFSTYPGLSQRQAGFHDLLLPILGASKHCGSQPCTQIVELRIYRPPTQAATGAYELVDRIAVTGPEELFAIAPLAPTLTQGSSRRLPLTNVNFIEGSSAAGIWFHLYGNWKRGSRVWYGQVVQYDPVRQRLYSLQNWSSPVGLPRWQQVTGDQAAELVVNQTIGLEPQFQVYQLKPPRSLAQPISLEAISLTEAVIADRSYVNGLLLARHGLWSPALQLLKSVKSTVAKGKWSASAQAQLDLVSLHAKITQMQAKRDWASPTQQILAQVMDGRWASALSFVKSAHSSGYDVQNVLQTNADRLWQRIEAALRVNPRQADLQTWGALVLAVKQNREQAMAWLEKQPQPTGRATAETLALLQPTAPSPDTSIPVAAPAAAPVAPANSPGCLIGSVTPIATIQKTDWLTPAASDLRLSAQQTWYRIEVVGLQSGQQSKQQWYPASSPALEISTAAQRPQQLWNLLGLAEPLQIVAWQGTTPAHTISATVKAFQLRNGSLSLLAVGEAIPATVKPSAMVAITPSTMSWKQPIATQTLAELAEQSAWKQALLQLWQELQSARLGIAESADPLLTIGDWAVQLIELTGDQNPEAVLTIEAASGNPRTLIFSRQGTLYSDLQREQTLVAITEQQNSPLPTLILTDAQGIYLQQWSSQNQQFE